MPHFTKRLPWPPTGNNHIRHVRGRHYPTQRFLDFKAAVLAICGSDGEQFDKPVTIHIKAWMPDRKIRDLDNLLKPTIDAIKDTNIIADDDWRYVWRKTVELCGVDEDKEGYLWVLITDDVS